jgi:UvrD-like helicase C-terminal domain
MALPGISNANEFYSAHYLECVLAGDIKKVRELWAEEAKAQLEANPTGDGSTPEALFKALRKPWQQMREAEFGIADEPAERLIGCSGSCSSSPCSKPWAIRLLRRWRNSMACSRPRALPPALINADESDDPSDTALRLATMHRVKGLEFDQVFLPGLDASPMPLEFELNNRPDQLSKDLFEQQERSLLHGAATRAKKRVVVSFSGKPSPFLGPA